MPFQKGNKLGSHKNHKNNLNTKIACGTKWMMRGTEVLRVPLDEINVHMINGWVLGRPKPSEETRKKQSESGKKAYNPGRFQSGHQTWNRGDKIPEEFCWRMSAGRLRKYGITLEQVEDAKKNGLEWCSEHLVFEPKDQFTILQSGARATRCKNSHKKYSPWYRQKFEEQSGACAICRKIVEETLCLDHWHDCENPRHTRKHEPLLECECSRGLLCNDCNFSVGYQERMMRSMTTIPDFRPDTWERKCVDYLVYYGLKSRMIKESHASV